ncbi:MAG TPA: hypothetical protein VGP87_12115 [Gemmatimonadales bacterium]|nr:hypothetical protein [Gemmatimonadales bacterium]
MTGWLRGLAAVVMGLVVGFVVTFGIEWINNLMFPLAPGTDPRNADAMRAAIAALPAPALLVVLLGWFLAALSGAWVATRIARGDHRPAWVLGVLLVTAAIGNLLAIPHPVWFWIAGLALYPVGVGLGARLGSGPVTPAG